jgi:hypothetical protein
MPFSSRPWLYCHRSLVPGPAPFCHEVFRCVSFHEVVRSVLVVAVAVVVVEVVRVR